MGHLLVDSSPALLVQKLSKHYGATQALRDLEAWIARDNPSAEDIERALDSGRVPK